VKPGDLPGADELSADAEARVGARVEGFLRHDLAVARVRGGLVDPAYYSLGDQLRAGTRDVPKLIDPNSPREVLGALLETWATGAARYGSSGAAYAEPEGRREGLEVPSALATEVARNSQASVGGANRLVAAARLQEFADGRAGVGLHAEVEIHQLAGGRLESVRLLRRSGLAAFDVWVGQRAREVALSLSLDGGVGARALRSVWSFDGRVTYRKKLKLAELDTPGALVLAGKAALSILTLGPPGGTLPGLVGRFDERSGAFDMVDLSNPSYECDVTLQEAD
jgi:hypothetical protein